MAAFGRSLPVNVFRAVAWNIFAQLFKFAAFTYLPMLPKAKPPMR